MISGKNKKDFWRAFLDEWREVIVAEHDSNVRIWERLKLPNVDEISYSQPDINAVKKLMESGKLSESDSLVSFFYITNGWPLWFGEYKISISPASEVDFFQKRSPESFRIAVENAPSERVVDGIDTYLSRDELDSCLMLSSPEDAREVVLMTTDGEVCLFQFYSSILYCGFEEFMKAMRAKVVDGIRRRIGVG